MIESDQPLRIVGLMQLDEDHSSRAQQLLGAFIKDQCRVSTTRAKLSSIKHK